MLSGETFRPDSQPALLRIFAGYPRGGKNFRIGTHYFRSCSSITLLTSGRVQTVGTGAPLLLMGRLDEASDLAAGQGIFPGGSFTGALFRKPEQRELFFCRSRRTIVSRTRSRYVGERSVQLRSWHQPDMSGRSDDVRSSG